MKNLFGLLACAVVLQLMHPVFAANDAASDRKSSSTIIGLGKE
jgi:hypothetical protein